MTAPPIFIDPVQFLGTLAVAGLALAALGLAAAAALASRERLSARLRARRASLSTAATR